MRMDENTGVGYHTKLSKFHVAIIMDGSGRWAETRSLPRSRGHHAGARAVSRVVKAAPLLGISTLTLYAFSFNNWGRPSGEVEALMDIFSSYLREKTDEWIGAGIRVAIIGSRQRLPQTLLKTVAATELATAGGNSLYLRIAIDYSGRESILSAANRSKGDKGLSQESFSCLLSERDHANGFSSDVDLLIRSGGEMRLSDFLLWECAYAELVFTKTMWPDFGGQDLQAAVEDYHSRERRFGRLPD